MFVGDINNRMKDLVVSLLKLKHNQMADTQLAARCAAFTPDNWAPHFPWTFAPRKLPLSKPLPEFYPDNTPSHRTVDISCGTSSQARSPQMTS